MPTKNPLAAHAEPEQRARDRQLDEVLRQARQPRADGEQEHGRHQRLLAPEPVATGAERLARCGAPTVRVAECPHCASRQPRPSGRRYRLYLTTRTWM